MKRFIRIIIYLAISAIIISPFATSTAYASFKTYEIPTALTTETTTPDVNIELAWDYLGFIPCEGIIPDSIRVIVNQQELPYFDYDDDGRNKHDVYPLENGYYLIGDYMHCVVCITYDSCHYDYCLEDFVNSDWSDTSLNLNHFQLTGLPDSIDIQNRDDYDAVQKIIQSLELANEFELASKVTTYPDITFDEDGNLTSLSYPNYEIAIGCDTTSPLSGNTIPIKVSPLPTNWKGKALIFEDTPNAYLYGFGEEGQSKTFEIPVTILSEQETPAEESTEPSEESGETPENPVDNTKSSVEIPMGYITFDEYGHIDKSSITVKANGEVLSEDDYSCDDGRDSDGATKSFSVLAHYNGKDYLVSVDNASTSYDLNNYQLMNIPETITAKNKKDEESIKNALKNMVFQNQYATLERGDKTYAIVISDIKDTAVEIRLVGHKGYSFGGEIYKYINIPIAFTDTEEQTTSTEEGEGSGNETNEGTKPSEPANESVPEPTPEQEPLPIEPAMPNKKAENRYTIEASGRGYQATVSMNNPIPYAKSKKVLARSLDVKCTVTDADGNSTRIYVKSVKATKAKNGFTKVTIKLKGRTKLERKAVKQMNNSLKKILVEVSS